MQNGVNVPEAEIWPLVGAFFGNYATWVELDMVPDPVPATTAGVAGTSTANVELSLADLRYVEGNQDFFYGLRAGLIARPRALALPDQWIDDGAIPLMDVLSAMHKATGTDTLATPLGAMNQPQMGVEFQASWTKSFLTWEFTTALTAPMAITMPRSRRRPGADERPGQGFEGYCQISIRPIVQSLCVDRGLLQRPHRPAGTEQHRGVGGAISDGPPVRNVVCRAQCL